MIIIFLGEATTVTSENQLRFVKVEKLIFNNEYKEE